MRDKDAIKIVKIEANSEGEIRMEVCITKTMVTELFDSEYCRKYIVESIAKKVVDEIPISIMNEVIKKIDINAVAKTASMNLAHRASGT